MLADLGSYKWHFFPMPVRMGHSRDQSIKVIELHLILVSRDRVGISRNQSPIHLVPGEVSSLGFLQKKLVFKDRGFCRVMSWQFRTVTLPRVTGGFIILTWRMHNIFYNKLIRVEKLLISIYWGGVPCGCLHFVCSLVPKPSEIFELPLVWGRHWVVVIHTFLVWLRVIQFLSCVRLILDNRFWPAQTVFLEFV